MNPFTICTCLEVASFIARKCNDFQYQYNATKLSRLLYCAYGTVLVEHHKILCLEQPRVWDFGPVFPKVYYFVKEQMGDISNYSFAFDNSSMNETVTETIQYFGKFSCDSLVKWSTKLDTPWAKAKEDNPDRWNQVIPIEYIYEYFNENVLVEEQENDIK